jgi:hypothetical protein
MYDNAFANPTDVCNETPHRAPTKPIDPRGNLNRPPLAGNPLDIRYARTNDAQDAPPHCFNFR